MVRPLQSKAELGDLTDSRRKFAHYRSVLSRAHPPCTLRASQIPSLIKIAPRS